MINVANWLLDNWSVLVALISVVIVCILAAYKFLCLPSKVQVDKIKKCLLGWVIAAEKDLGAKTGRVKLSVVYGQFVKSFPFVKNFVSFDTFSIWVDDALVTMREMLKDNKNLKEVVNS